MLEGSTIQVGTRGQVNFPSDALKTAFDEALVTNGSVDVPLTYYNSTNEVLASTTLRLIAMTIKQI